MIARATQLAVSLSRRRTVRDFSDRPLPDAVIEQAVRAAGSAPSGANMQPWHFSIVQDPKIKHEIRVAAEAEEREFYAHRASPEWLDALAPLGTDSDKPFLEIAPCLIAVFVQRWGHLPDGRKVKHYYPTESVGLATGLLIATLHQAGVATLTHTPSPMKFLNRILGRPTNERPFLLLVAGFPAKTAKVPDIGRKPLKDIATWHK
ncbi:MAG: nitroreductase family protein [Gammaproteobacteria bacterium]|nr:nitroreductase family protein [Gammaproteobacteria bacterium]NND58724.1 nitroreductase family protein [Gammaproteobacteria bacterium]